MKHLPPRAQAAAEQQGWDEDSIIMHLVEFIESQVLLEELEEYFEEVANEEIENSEGDDLEEEDFEVD